MSDTERVIGELKEFKRATLEELAQIRAKVDSLDAFKWRVTGAMLMVIGALEILGQVARAGVFGH